MQAVWRSTGRNSSWSSVELFGEIPFRAAFFLEETPMSEPIAWLNGKFLPFSQAALPLSDLGVVGGIAVSEMIRTYAGKPFRVAEHLARLKQSCELVGFAVEMSDLAWEEVIAQLLADNLPLIASQSDLGVILFVTAGPNPTYVGKGLHSATVGAHTFVLPFANWAPLCESGLRLVTPPGKAIPAETVDRRIKSRSRLAWHLADRAAKQIDPQASALLLDEKGFVTETATGNLVVCHGDVLSTPLAEQTLEGISLGMVRDLTSRLGWAFQHRPLTVDDVLTAEEAFVTSTPTGLLPVRLLNGQPIGQHVPGPRTTRLLAEWGQEVGVDLVGQMRNALLQTR